MSNRIGMFKCRPNLVKRKDETPASTQLPALILIKGKISFEINGITNVIPAYPQY